MDNGTPFQRLFTAFPGVYFSEEMKTDFRDWWIKKDFEKKEFITESGKIERYFYFIIEGVQVIYLINHKGDKVVFGFSYDGSFSGVYDSLLKQIPSSFILESLSETRTLALSYSHWEQMMDKYPQFEKSMRIFNQDILFGRLKREVELATLNAEERYTAFMRRCPPQLRTVPQKYLAAYLSMTPETFSRLRASVDY